MDNKIFESTEKLINWIEQNKYESYDHYDYWSSKYGIISRRIFNRNKFLGFPLVSSVFFLDTYFPSFRKIFAKRASSAEAIPRIAVSYFRLFQLLNNPKYLTKGRKLLDWSLENVSHTNHGIGWGLHFDWEGRAPKNTPCVTVTAYSTEALIKGFDLTGYIEYRNFALRTAEFVAKDLNRMNSEKSTALSYTPIDNCYVINANSYSARILLDFIKIQKDQSKIELMNRIVNYILEQQNHDGSWYYFDKNQISNKNNFIDSFHTCFVLQNLFEIWKWNKDERIKKAIGKGYDFFIQNFITPNYSVKHYHYYPFPTGILVDIRGCAEAIYCLTLLSEIYPSSLDIALGIVDWVNNNMQDKDGYYYFRIYRTHIHKKPYMRWGEAPMLNSLTYLLYKMKGSKNVSSR